MAEYVDSDMITVESVVKVTLDYEDYYLTAEAALTLRNRLNEFLKGA